jgi:hypothetical protein
MRSSPSAVSLLTSALLVLAPAGLTAAPAGPPEAFANAHVLLMVRSQIRGHEARLSDLEVWAEGTRLRARVHGGKGELWLDGAGSKAIYLVDGKVVEPKRQSLEAVLLAALVPMGSPPANANTDRIAGHPCKIVSEPSLVRCVWHGLPLSVEYERGGFSFNAAAPLVEEHIVTVADLQPPPGAPAAPASMSAGN